MLFAGLKEELQFTQDVENLYRLFNELNVSSTQNVFIKSLFWRDDILLKRFVDLAHGYVRESVAANIDERADEIELTVLILQTIAVMLRETEALPHCYRVLQNLSRSYFSKLIEVLLSPSNMAAQGWSRDSNISSLISEGTVASSEVLYEVINATQQITWVVDGESPAFNAIVLFNVIGQSKQLTDFLDRLMAACRKSWESGSDGSMGSSDRAPEDAVKVYRLFTVFHRIITGSNNAAQYAKDSFKEEFKYYIHPGSVAEKFPAEYPISGMGRAVVHAVGLCISGSAH